MEAAPRSAIPVGSVPADLSTTPDEALTLGYCCALWCGPRWAEHLKDMERRFRLRTDPVFDADAYYVHEAGLSDLRSALDRGASIERLQLSRVINEFLWADGDMVVPIDLPHDHDLAGRSTERGAIAVVEDRARYLVHAGAEALGPAVLRSHGLALEAIR